MATVPALLSTPALYVAMSGRHVVVGVHHSMPATAGNQDPVHRHRDYKATISDAISDHQNSVSPSPAAIAPGTTRMNALSMISMTVIETVSAANATPMARRKPTPARRTGLIVSE